jgi:uncharacterized membrane protein
MGGAFWDFLFELFFFSGFRGAASGAGMGALRGSLADVGIDDDFIKEVRKNVNKPQTKANSLGIHR